MKRAKAEVIGAPFFQFYKLAHHIDNIDAVSDLLYGIRGDQVLSLKYKVISTKIKEWCIKLYTNQILVTRYPFPVTGNW